MPMTYAFRLFLGEEFSYCKEDVDYLCMDLLNDNGALGNYDLAYWMILCAMLVGFHVLGLVLLRVRLAAQVEEKM